MLLLGCSSQQKHNISTPLSEAAKAAASTSQTDNSIISSPSYSGFYSNSHIQANIAVVSDPFYFDDDLNLTSLDSRVSLYRTQTTSFHRQGYTQLPGMKLSLAGKDNQIQYRFSLGYSPAVFTSPHSEGLRDLHIFEISGDISAIKQFNDVAFELGGRMGTGVASFAFASPLNVAGREVRGDGIGTFFLAVPVGIQIDLGTVTVESHLAPTLTLHNAETEVGFDNDIVSAKWSLPLAIGLGINF
ncbi:MAG: hypothetical protein ACI9DO_002504 [Reinekea sp.]|jgi:hypothetical protein